MRPLRRILATVLLGAAIAALSFAPAQAFSVTGGTQEQRADVHATIVAGEYPPISWVESKVGPVRIEILDSYPPYWVSALGSSDDVLVDVFSATAAGVAWPGNIKIHSVYVPGTSTFLREIAAHEWSHQVWFALLYVPGASVEWKQRVTEGLTPNPAVWTQNYVEAHAEELRVAAWTPAYYMTLGPRTDLNLLGNDAVREFHARWTSATTTTTITPATTTTRTVPPVSTTTSTTAPPPPPTTTTTAPRGAPFPDVPADDTELWAAAWWARDLGLVWGYPDGTLGPYDHLTHRHAALIADRWLGSVLPGWIDDYAPVTRGELRDAHPGLTWDSERWNEALLRSQLIRLLWREGA